MKKTLTLSALVLLIPLAIWWTLRESPERRIDREFGWKEVKPYVTATD